MTTRRGLSMVEVLVVIGLLGVLVGLFLPAVQSSRGTAVRVGCQNTLRQLALSLHSHHARHGRLPPGGFGDRKGPHATHSPDVLLSWRAHVLMDVGEATLWENSWQACRSENRPWVTPPHVGYVTPVRAFVCPADDRLVRTRTTPKGYVTAFSSFLGNGGSITAAGVLEELPGIRYVEVTDGLSTTLLLGERPPPNTFDAGQWYHRLFQRETFGGPDESMVYMGGLRVSGDPCGGNHPFGPGRLDNRCDMRHYWSLHRGGANFAFADGSVRFLPYSAEPLMVALSTRSGGETVADVP